MTVASVKADDAANMVREVLSLLVAVVLASMYVMVAVR